MAMVRLRQLGPFVVILAALPLFSRILWSLGGLGGDESQLMAPTKEEQDLFDANDMAVAAFAPSPTPSVAFLLLGFEDSLPPEWATDDDDVFIFAPPARCPDCQEHAQKSSASGPYVNASEGWWCAQRSYLEAISLLLQQYPNKDYYLLADSNTAIFPLALQILMRYLDDAVLRPTDDLYMGHGMDLSQMGPDLPFKHFIMSGGGVLVRGLTLRRLAASDTLADCISKVYNGTWCWHHLDWILAECLKEINVHPQGHPAFQQHATSCDEYPEPWRCCHEATVACHPVPEGAPMADLVRLHHEYLQANLHTLSSAWATPCPPDAYEWSWRGWSVVSICNEWGYESLYGKNTSGEFRGRGFPRDFR